MAEQVELTVVGKSLPKVDARAKVTGGARYTADLHLPGMLVGRLLRSPYAHARVLSIDTSAAEAMPGVLAVLTYRNAPGRPFTNGEWDAAGHSPLPPDQKLFDTKVRHAGEPVAAVAAVDLATARAALAAIQVQYQPLPVVVDVEAALAPGAPLVHEDQGNNLAGRLQFGWGDVAAGFAQSDGIIERRFRTGKQKQVQLEPYACIADPGADGRLTVWSPNQTPHFLRAKLAQTFALPASRVRIITPTIGGAFGGRLGFVAEPYCVALALAARRPVCLEFDRLEDFIGTESRHPITIALKVGYRRDGTLTAIAVRSYLNTGPYVTHGMAVNSVHGHTILRMYRCDHVAYEGLLVYTNTPLSGGFRGFGGPQGYFALEQIIDEVAERSGQNPLELRRRLAYQQGDRDPWTGLTIPDSGILQCIDAGAAAIDWAARRRERAVQPSPDAGPWRRGIGMGCVMWVSGTACLGSGMSETGGATVRLNLDGSYNLVTGAVDLGTGARTTLGQVAAETLGCPITAIDVLMDDTDLTPFDSGCHATRTLFVCGNAARAAAAEARRQVLELAAEMLESDPAELDMRQEGIGVRGVPDRSVTLGEIAKHALARGIEVVGRGAAPQVNSPPFGAHFAEVLVNIETGQVRVLRYVAAHDVGRAVNPQVVQGQIEGGVVQGIGFALQEDLLVDPATGAVLNGNFMDYRFMSAADTPPIEVLMIESPDPAGPFGAKGIGEPGIVPVAGVLANAIYNAIRVRMSEAPMTSERVLRAFQARQ